MSLLFDPSIARIKEGKIGGDGMVELFENLAAEAEQNNLPIITLIIPYVDNNDELVKDTYIPELHLIVRKIDD